MTAQAKAPAISVLLPVFNGATYLQRAIQSILEQTSTDWELLILDDESRDESQEIIQSFSDARIRAFHNVPRLGLAENLNLGLREARADIVARQDQDDISDRTRLEKQLRFLRDHPAIAVVGSEAISIDDDEEEIEYLFRPQSSAAIRWAACFSNCMIHSSVTFRKGIVLEELGGYQDWYNTEDYDLWSRVGQVHEIANIPEPLIKYRVHGGSMMGGVARDRSGRIVEARARVIHRNLRTIFGTGQTDREAVVLASFESESPVEVMREYINLLNDLRQRYLVENPSLRHDSEMKRTFAMQLCVVAYKLLPRFRAAALGLYVRSFILAPALALRLPWKRMIGLFLLGDSARSLYVWWRKSRAGLTHRA